MDEDSLGFLRELVETPGPSGYEGDVLEVWRGRVEDSADEVRVDAYGNTTATLNPGMDSSVVLTGHADEIGFMVNHVTEEGYVYMKKVGGVDAGIAPGKRLVIHGRDGPVRGVVGRKPVHLQEEEERGEAPDIEDLFVDVGAGSREEAREAGVHVGASATYDVGFDSLLGDVVVGRGLDNRIGLWVAAEAFRAVEQGDLDVTLHAGATVQEELGLRGARMLSYSLEPSVALVVDVTFATDVPGIEATQHGEVELGGGPSLKHGKENHPAVLERLREAASERGIDLQEEAIMSRGATDADAFYVSRGGIPTASVGVPNRYMHTAAELVDLGDLEAVRDLFKGFVVDLEGDASFGVA